MLAQKILVVDPGDLKAVLRVGGQRRWAKLEC